jgi:hypothetical protein
MLLEKGGEQLRKMLFYNVLLNLTLATAKIVDLGRVETFAQQPWPKAHTLLVPRVPVS